MALQAVAEMVIEKLAVERETGEVRSQIKSAVGQMMQEEVIEEEVELLRLLYEAEDVIETFALVPHQRRRSSLWSIGGFFNPLCTHQFPIPDIAISTPRRQLHRRMWLNSDSKAEDVIQTSAQRRRSSLWSIGGFFNALCTHQFPIPDIAISKRRRQLHWKMRQIRMQLKKLNPNSEVAGSFSSSSRHAISQVGNTLPPINSQRSFDDCLWRQPSLMVSYSFDEEGESSTVGLEENLNSLVNQLQNTEIITIIGAKGSGKTTLAHAIYKNRGIKQCFECRALVYVSQGYTLKDVLLNILKQMKTLEDKDADMTEQQLLRSRLPEALKKVKCLIVADDVSARDVEELKHAFADIRNGTKMIVTISDEKPALSANPPNIIQHEMKPFSPPDSWKMFLKAARLPKSTDVESDLMEAILEKCQGLPLWIVLLGGLLSTKKTPNYERWRQVVFEPSNRDILSLSYNDVPFRSKLCLLYLALFPKGYDIPVRRLLRLWLAEGFVFVPENVVHESPKEDVLLEYFEDLVKRNLIQISKLRSDGSPRRCRLLGALHESLLSKAKAISLFHIHYNNSCGGAANRPLSVRRVVEYSNIKNCDLSDLHNLRSYLSFNIQQKDTPAIEVGKFLSRIIDCKGLGLLRVLDLEGVYKPSLPDNLGDLFNLRYLGLRWTFLDHLPSSVGKLPYLATLDVKHTNINSLPESIWKLKHLRHLNLNEIRLDKPPEGELLTLWGLLVDDKCPVRNGLDKLTSLRELGITFNLRSGQEDIADWVAKLISLRSLRLRSKDERGRPSELSLKPLSSLAKLSHLYLLGSIQKLPARCDFPPVVKVLTLSVSRLEEDPMPILGQLPELTVLRLLADSYQGKNIICHGFSKLRVLKLWMLRELEDWDVEEGAMLNLKELNIRCCPRLKKIPRKLMKLYTLEDLILTNMPVEFKNNAQVEKLKHTSLTVNNWEFTPLPWEQDSLSHKKN